MSEGLLGTGFWAEIKWILGHHNTLPNTIDAIQGGSNIADIFQEKYKSYNCFIWPSPNGSTVGKDKAWHW